MGFRLSFGIGPLRYSKSLSGGTRRSSKTTRATATPTARQVERKRIDLAPKFIDIAVSQLDNVAGYSQQPEVVRLAKECAGYLRDGDALKARLLLQAMYDQHLKGKRGLQPERDTVTVALKALAELPDGMR
jgi:hypothetical protein